MTFTDPTGVLDAPWLESQIEQLRRARASGRWPPALLLHEQRGSGGEAVARYAAQLALCRAPTPPCGSCRDCRLFGANQHPDFITVKPLEDSKLIRVEQVRELCEQLALTAHGGHGTVALLTPADSLNLNAANALLKTLEEPRPGASLILVSTLPGRLPATILSRCQRLRIRAPTRQAAVAWLERRRGKAPWNAVLEVVGEAPFDALDIDAIELSRLKAETDKALADLRSGQLDIARTADTWARADSFELRLSCLENWLTARINSAIRRLRQPRELRSGAHLPEPASDLNMAGLLGVLDGIYELRRLRLSSINRPLALEQLLWELARAPATVERRATG